MSQNRYNLCSVHFQSPNRVTGLLQTAGSVLTANDDGSLREICPSKHDGMQVLALDQNELQFVPMTNLAIAGVEPVAAAPEPESVAIGFGAQATGKGSVAIGESAIATKPYTMRTTAVPVLPYDLQVTDLDPPISLHYTCSSGVVFSSTIIDASQPFSDRRQMMLKDIIFYINTVHVVVVEPGAGNVEIELEMLDTETQLVPVHTFDIDMSEPKAMGRVSVFGLTTDPAVALTIAIPKSASGKVKIIWEGFAMESSG
jgi:hypothetical protein